MEVTRCCSQRITTSGRADINAVFEDTGNSVFPNFHSFLFVFTADTPFAPFQRQINNTDCSFETGKQLIVYLKKAMNCSRHDCEVSHRLRGTVKAALAAQSRRRIKEKRFKEQKYRGHTTRCKPLISSRNWVERDELPQFWKQFMD